MLSEFGMEELGWPVQSLDYNLTEHLWDEIETVSQAFPSNISV